MARIPKSFKDKYKELNPENYLEDVEKIMQQGKTPAGMHRSICVKEIMEFLKVVPGQLVWMLHWVTADIV
jgi:16S rRNA (cytosine1402-N4)-methyltransferase